VNHSGDSDSTGAIAGNLLGAALGAGSIPPRWLDTVELRSVIESVADDLHVKYREGEEWHKRYPV
jgi:ADP-ribosylglycohydrolase